MKHLLFQTKFKDFPSELTGPSAPSLWNSICLPILMFANSHSEYYTSIDLICYDSNWWYFFWNMAAAWRQYILREANRHKEIRVRLAGFEKNDEGGECTHKFYHLLNCKHNYIN